MARISSEEAGGANVVAFLDMLAWSEGTSTSPATRADGYDVIVTGHDGKPEIFTDYGTHPFAGGRPSKRINSKGLTSNASGRYQQMLRDWPHYRVKLQLPDFGPISQDRLAIQHIRECRALDDVKSGHISRAIEKCARIWASLPGAGYGQREHSLQRLLRQYQKAGGDLVA
ncbi:glycoside hydrolase family 24 protein [Pseudomonas aeruginosa]|jgi:muramidase (phage lysozyme)|uniref:glycoside hydrolase family 24 protein n=1 Tax=Pseudomonas aeruginosa TaxID=287 RepID=UPI0002F173FA|nr:glycoside hydrolase family 104 protein [Pseudomonas aeruginosa]EIU3316455.1 glycoside hydrolase family 104 protein [Pseudomonas aeruginosa]EIY2512154.1 glycoside hydrolase family 104 protein [Pseudomonas aeruginosa]EIY2820326.1 glycoside hydrolase family 104 protein [Pseudomonas aeruginosa]EKT8668884.1 glycoside hydrolase family 104 protein [Pseudomonas aeruginosa]EKU2957377.1 glycoside hydrolase family 104 protein [Pseudomonas aeruginosa]